VFPRAVSDDMTGLWAATGLYMVLVMITLLAAAGLMETIIRYIAERRRLTRVFAATSGSILIWFLGLGTLLSFNVMQSTEVFFGRNFFDGLQWLTGRVLLPLVGLLLCVFLSRILPDALLGEMWGSGASRALAAWKWTLRFPARVCLIVLLLYCVGALDFLITLWS
jgi:NSS family neurotransmitter:Na+ symporter